MSSNLPVKPSFLLLLSLVFNMLLLGVLVLPRLQKTPTAAHVTAFTTAPAPTPEAAATPPAQASDATLPPKSPAFSWSQLESSDYPTYIANLRSVSCPETTVRDIISADVEGLYRKQRKELSAQAQSSRMNPGVLNEHLRQLDLQQAQLLVKLLGPPAEETQEPKLETAQNTAAPDAVTQAQPEQEKTAIPLILFAPAAQEKLDPSQQEQLKTMVAQFTEAIGGPNQNPNDPAYLERWSKAQAAFDELLHAKLGDDVYGQLKSQAMRHSLR